MAQRMSCQNDAAVEKPKRASAVSATEAAVRMPVPRVRTSRSVRRLETMVPKQMMQETMPAEETAAPRAACIVGQAAPRRPSGRPRLTKAR